MTRFPPERWQQVREIFDAAIEMSLEERESFLHERCGTDDALRAEVESLVAAAVENDSLVDEVVRRAADRAASPLRVGTMLGPYRILEAIGEGGMGSVYLAERSDETFAMRVAIKVVRGGLDSARILERFHEERRILAALDHPNIARVLDGGSTSDGLPYLVMEHIAGSTIHRYCDAHRLGVRERIVLFRGICEAVDHAHHQLIVHRDIKPANVLVTEEGVPKLLDFGIAKLIDAGPGDAALTGTGMRPMTPEYASPEQIRGEPVTTATDVHALGILLYELLTGRHPFTGRGTTPRELEAAVLESEPVSPSTAVTRSDGDFDAAASSEIRATSPAALRRELAGDLDNIILKALAKEPERRYRSAAELSADLDRHLGGHPVLARPATFSYRAGKFLRRNLVGVSIAVAFLATIVAASVVSTRAYLRADRMRVEAETQRDRLEEVNSFLAATFRAASPEARQSAEEVTAREILDAAAERVELDLSGRPEIAAALETEIGRRYFDLGIHDRAEALLRRAVDTYRASDGLATPEGATALTYLGQTLGAGDRLEEAMAVLQEAAGLDADIEPHRMAPVFEARQSLGIVYTSAGEYVEARRQFEGLLQDFEREEYAAVPDIVSRRGTVANDLGLLQERLGNYDEAERLVRRFLACMVEVHGENHSKTGEAWANLAFILNRAGRMEEGVECARRALEIHTRVLGDDHLQVANSRINLADALVGIGQFEEADTLYPRVLEVYRAVYGDDHPRIGTVLNNSGIALLNHGAPDRARPRFEEAAGIYGAAFGAEHQYTAIARHNAVRALHEAGRLEEAERAARENLELRERIFDGDHPDIARSQVLLAAILRERGACHEAEPLLREAVRMTRAGLSPAHPVRAGAERALARCLADLERYDEAERLFESLVAVADSAHGAEDSRTLRLRAELDSLRSLRASP